MAKGEVIASSVTGTLKSSSVATNEAAMTPRLSASIAEAAASRMGWAMMGINPSVAPPQARKVNIVSGCGDLSACLPADGVTRCEVDQDQPDDDGPDQVDAAETHLQQARSAELGGQRGHPGEEDGEGDVASHGGIIPVCKL